MALSAGNTTTSSQTSSPNLFYDACHENKLEEAQHTFHIDYLNAPDANGNAPLHIASMRGYVIIIRLLFRYHADLKVKNNMGLTPQQVAKDDEVKHIFQSSSPDIEDSKKFISQEDDLEWIDSYKNAHRIAYENRDHLQRWLLKIPFEKLLEELRTGYVNPMKFSSTQVEKKIEEYMNLVIQGRLIGLLRMYTDPIEFYGILNKNLAEIGSAFRFRGTQVLFNSGYLDNEPPKGLGQYIYTAILMNHPFFDKYYRGIDKNPTYRGMNITADDRAQYQKGEYVLTRSFLSSSKNKNISELFRASEEAHCKQLQAENRLPVVCEYTICNPRSALDLTIGVNPQEAEVLIVPFVVFEIMDIIESETSNATKYVTIKLTERDTAP